MYPHHQAASQSPFITTLFAALGLLGTVQDLVQRPEHGPFLLGEVAGLLHGLLGVEVVVRRVALACK
jgi:hypothetical protein